MPARQSRLARWYSRLSPRLAHRPGSTLATRAHARLIAATGGRVGTRFVGGGRLLVLRTVGRRSGRPRESPVLFVEDGEDLVVGAANAASTRPPAWWLNLQAQPEAEAFVRGRWRPVRARRAGTEEEARLWPLLDEGYEGWEHYRAIATRELPIVILEPRD